MITFKDFITELTKKDIQAQGYGGTSDRTKFQTGDYVVIGWSNTKRGEQYVGHVGKVVGYKPSSMVVKYAVEFPDGNIETYLGQHVYGPFKDEITAKKYSRPDIEYGYEPTINPKDLKGYTGAGLDTKPKLETYMRSIVTAQPFNMTWLNKPKQFTCDKYVITVLASAPKPEWAKDLESENKNPTKVGDSKFNNFLSQNICFYRQNNIINGKLVIENFIERLGGIFNDSYSTSYFINIPFLKLKNLNHRHPINFFDKQSFIKMVKTKERSYSSCLMLQSIGVPLSINKDVNELIRSYLRPYDVLTGKYNPQEMFNTYYEVRMENGKKYLNGSVTANTETLSQFEGCYFDSTNPWRHRNKIYIYTNEISKIKIPVTLIPDSNITLDGEDIKNKSIIQNFNSIPSGFKSLNVEKYTIQSLEGIPENIKLQITNCILPSLKGLPKHLNELDISGSTITSFEGGQDTKITNNFVVTEDVLWGIGMAKSKKVIPSLKGLPQAGHYSIQGYEEKEIKKFLKDREFIDNLDPETKGDWGEIVGGL